MARTTPKDLDAAEALKFFKGQSVQVQTATPAKVKGSDGQLRDGYDVKPAALAEEHITGARDYGDRVVITTVDGQRHEAPKKADKAAA